MVEGKLEVFRTILREPVGKEIAVVQRRLRTVVQLKVVIDPIIGTVHNHLPVVVTGVRQNLFHGDGGKQNRIDPARGVGVEKRHPLQVASGAAQAVNDAALVQPAAVFRHGNVQNSVQLHPLTPPAVSPEVMYFWHRKKITSTGRDTVTAANTGQEPVISVA